MIKNLKYITSFDKKGTRNAILWEVIHSIFVASPSAILLVIIWELFSEKPNISKIWTVVTLMFIMLLLQFIVAGKSMVKTNLVVYNIGNELRICLGNRIQKFSLGFFKQKDPGEIASVVLQDVSNFESIFGHSAGNLASAIFGTTVLSIFLLIYDWRLALCLLSALLLIYPFLNLANYLVKKLSVKQISIRNKTGAKILEYIQGIRHLKSYGLIGKENKELKHTFDELKKKSISLEAIPGPFIITASIIFEIFFILMIALGLYYLSNHSITVPVLLTFLIMGYNLYAPLKIVMIDYLVLRYMNESLERIITVLETPTMETDHNEIPKSFDIAFHKVDFSYNEEKTLQDISFTVPEKSMLALIGHSGSGKSTIASLIARFWDVTEGSITIGNINIKNINQDKFYSYMSEVFQDVYLFDDSIYNNIKIGKPEATEREIIAAAEKAQVVEFTNQFPQGLHTLVGEGGNNLSGGQKQRISIARALLKDAPIVLLDEATASLDPENEIYIQQAIAELVKSKTVIVIAHKLATIQMADQIIVLEKGKIIEQGTHSSLINKNGIYKRMWDFQSRASGWKVKA
ncbi:ABC transporter ATP-binding protein [Myroides injenensis]|uniref:ABC transporter ATP-binding protein n=1 Tax=Myroides injenensis TaxID=1183151 RepID=UPI0022721651|nr:ABC transporter ATP-binding protein [Myroides injenensis]